MHCSRRYSIPYSGLFAGFIRWMVFPSSLCRASGSRVSIGMSQATSTQTKSRVSNCSIFKLFPIRSMVRRN